MSLSTITIEIEVILNAKVNEVWKAFTEDIHHWWSKDFYTSPKTQSFKLETNLGGKMYEDMGEGEGLVWANVVGVNKPNSLQLKGMLSPEFGGPAISFTKFTFESKDGGTLFKMTDTLMGAVDERTKKSLQEGWEMIFKDSFRNYVEK